MLSMTDTRSADASVDLSGLLYRSVAGGAGVRLLGTVLTFLVGVQLARGLGPEIYGIYALAISVLALLIVPIEFGVPQLLTREVAAAHGRRDWSRLLGVLSWADRMVVTVCFLMMVLTAMVLALTTQRIPEALLVALVAGLALMPMQAFVHLRSAALRGLQHVVLGQWPDIVVRPALFALSLLLIFRFGSNVDAATVMILNATSAGLAFLLASIWLRARLPDVIGTVRTVSEGRRWLAGAFPMALTEGMRVLQGHIATLMLGALATGAAVGLFKVAASTALIAAMPITLLNMIAAPIIARVFARNEIPQLRRLSAQVAGMMFVGVLALSLPLLLIGAPLLALVFGDEYRDSSMPLLVLCIGNLISAAFGAAAAVLNMCGHERRVTRAFALSLLVAVPAAVPLVAWFGEVGAAWANVLALSTWNLLMWLDARRHLGVDTSIMALAWLRRRREQP